MNIRGQIQGFAIGAAVMAAVMIGGPALLSSHADVSDATKIAATFGVKIVWSPLSPCILDGPEFTGCFDDHTPNTIYMKPGMDRANEYYVALHEIGHVLQHRLGKILNECDADRFAQSMGSTLGYYCTAIPNTY